VDGIAYSTTSANTVAITSNTPKYTGSITIPSTVDYSAVTYNVTSIGNNAFDNCDVTSITIPSSVTSIGDMAFFRCSGLTSITIPSSVTSIGEKALDGTAWYESQPDGLVYAGNIAYKYKGTMPANTSITIPNSVTSIGDAAFSFCSGLITINVDVDNANYSSSDGVLFNKDKTTIICYPGGKQAGYTIPSSVTSIGDDAFMYCSGLTSVTIPSSVTSIGNDAFSICSGLISINVDFDNANYSSSDGVLFNKDKTTIVCYPGGKQDGYTIPSSVTSIGNGAFMNCSSLTSVTIPSSITLIGDDAFMYCSSLTSVTIPSSVTSIGDDAFNNCWRLTSITIPNSVTSIGDGTFMYCSSLTSITIPNSVTSIGHYAFVLCTGLTSIYVYPTTPIVLSSSSNVFSVKSTCTLYVPTGSKEAYQAAAQWQDFSNIVEMTTAIPTVNDANFSLYLNPLDDAISVNGLQGTLRVFDINGRLLLTKQVAGNESVSVSTLPQGLYIAKMITAEGTVERKVLKK